MFVSRRSNATGETLLGHIVSLIVVIHLSIVSTSAQTQCEARHSTL